MYSLLAILVLSGAFVSLAHAEGTAQDLRPLVLAESQLDGEVVSDASLGTMRARYVDGNTPDADARTNGVILWDEVGSVGRPKDRNNHSSGSGNSQHNTLQLGTN